MSVYKLYMTILALCFIGFFSFLFPVFTIAADPTPQDVKDVKLDEVGQSQFSLCSSPPAYTFKSYKSRLLDVELEIPDIWRPEEEKDNGGIKFVGSSEDCTDAASLDYKSVRGFVPTVPYTLEEGEKFFGQQWMKPHKLIENIKLIKTSEGYSATYSADDFVGIAGVKLPQHTEPLVLVIFAERDGAHIEQRMLHMLNTLKYIKP